MLKADIRREMKARKRLFTQQELGEQSRAIVSKLLSHPRLQSAKTVLMYHSLPDEVDTHEAIQQLARAGKTIVLPAVTGEGQMELRLYTNEQNLETGRFGIKEPCSKRFAMPETIDLAVIPGVAFDKDNNRLGRGKGYYDRFLPTIPQTYKIGICFDFQKVEYTPTGSNDVKMDEVL